jgi:hypothetical protein
MRVSSDGVALGLITTVQKDIGVWVCRTASAVAWSRCHLACHWLPDLPSDAVWLFPANPKARHHHGAMTGEPGPVTKMCEWVLPLPVKGGPQGGHHLSGCAFRFDRRRYDAAMLLGGAESTPWFAAGH